MKQHRFLALLSGLVLCAAAASARDLTPDQVKAVLDKNPDLLLDVLRAHKKELFTIVNDAAQEEQAHAREEEAAKEKKDFDEAFKKPMAPAIDDKTRIRGNKNAKYTLVEYSDFQCPYCARGFKTVEDLRKKYGSDIRFIYKNKPLFGMHPQAMPAAEYFEAVAIQSPEKSWQFHDKMFENQDKLGEDFYKQTAKDLGLDVKKLEKDAKSPEVKARIDADMAEADKFGFSGTPGFLLNGIPVRGAYPADFFDTIVQRLDLQAKDQKN